MATMRVINGGDEQNQRLLAASAEAAERIVGGAALAANALRDMACGMSEPTAQRVEAARVLLDLYARLVLAAR